jgi:hypothetical protein
MNEDAPRWTDTYNVDWRSNDADTEMVHCLGASLTSTEESVFGAGMLYV